MSNSEDNRSVETQARRHSPALIGIILSLIVAGVAAWVFLGGGNDDDVGRTGEPAAGATAEGRAPADAVPPPSGDAGTGTTENVTPAN